MEKAKIVDSGSQCSAPETKGSQLQYEPYLFSVTGSQTELAISRKKLGEQITGRSTNKLKSFKAIPYVKPLKEHVLSCNMIPISFPQRVPRPSYPFRRNFGRSGKGSFTEKAKIVDRGSLSSKTESTGYKLQYEAHLFSVARSQTELFVWGEIWVIRKIVVHRKS